MQDYCSPTHMCSTFAYALRRLNGNIIIEENIIQYNIDYVKHLSTITNIIIRRATKKTTIRVKVHS